MVDDFLVRLRAACAAAPVAIDRPVSVTLSLSEGRHVYRIVLAMAEGLATCRVPITYAPGSAAAVSEIVRALSVLYGAPHPDLDWARSWIERVEASAAEAGAVGWSMSPLATELWDRLGLIPPRRESGQLDLIRSVGVDRRRTGE